MDKVIVLDWENTDDLTPEQLRVFDALKNMAQKYDIQVVPHPSPAPCHFDTSWMVKAILADRVKLFPDEISPANFIIVDPIRGAPISGKSHRASLLTPSKHRNQLQKIDAVLTFGYPPPYGDLKIPE